MKNVWKFKFMANTINKLLIVLFVFALHVPSALAAQVIGYVDGSYFDAYGNPIVSGWACATGIASSIQVDLYVNQGYPSGQFVGRFAANRPSEPALASICGSSGSSYRFAIPVPGVTAGVLIYVYGISPVGGSNLLLTGSGQFKIPANYMLALYPGSVTTGTSFTVYDATWDSASGCAPFLDWPIYPVSFPSSDGNGVELRLNAVSPASGGNNYWIKGQMNAVGSETKAFHVDCSQPTLKSPHNSDSTKYLGGQWLAGFYKQPDGSLFSIVHNEFYGGYFPPGLDFSIPSSPQCNLGSNGLSPYGKLINPVGCTYSALEMAAMPRGASSFNLSGTAPSQVIARPSFSYVPNVGQPTGYFTNTNILRNSDGFYYSLTTEILPNGSQRRCPIRTSDLTNPSSWRGWGGSGFTANIPAGQDCADTGLAGIFPFYLGYNTYFQKIIMVGALPIAGAQGAPVLQMGYSLSSDFVNWSQPVSFGIPIFDSDNGDWSQNNYPSLVDPSALQQTQDGNASTGGITGQGPWLVFIQHNANARTRAIAVPLSFSK